MQLIPKSVMSLKDRGELEGREGTREGKVVLKFLRNCR